VAAFYDESIQVLTEKVATGYYTFLSPWWDDISSSVKDLITHLLCVDPEKRYTIDEFLAHPWINQKPSKPALDPKTAAHVAMLKEPVVVGGGSRPLDSPLLQAQAGRTNLKSPGIAQLREAFDVTYAVHRMEEEGARRRAHGAAGAGGGGARAYLPGLNEVDEDEAGEVTRRAIEAKSRQQQQSTRRAGAPGAPPGGSSGGRAAAAAALAGDASLAEGRAGPRDRGVRHHHHHGRQQQPTAAAPPAGGDADGSNSSHWFDLNMGGATLLNRRQRADDVKSLSITPIESAPTPTRAAR
jgi:hypothetical protein